MNKPDTGFGLPWAALLRAGLVGLRLTPDQFWKLTLRELDVALDTTGTSFVSDRSTDRETLEALIAAYPDKL